MKRITKPLLIILAVAGIVMAGFQAVNTYTNVRAIPVTSELMEPAILRGSLLLMTKTPEKELKSGDVIAVGLPNQHNHAVGRLIQSNQMADGYYNLVFKGDNRTLPEDFPYTIKDSTYVNKVTIPLLGFIIVFLSSPFGLILFAGAAIYFAWYYLYKMHDRMSWSERSLKRVSYNRRLALEQAEIRKEYEGLDFFLEAEEPLNESYSGADEYNEDEFIYSDEDEHDDSAKAKEPTR